MLLTYLSYVAVFFLGFIVAAVFRIDARNRPVRVADLDQSYRNLRAGRMTETDEADLVDAAQFERDSSRGC